VTIRIRDPDTDPYHDTGKTCLGGGMHCPSVLLVYAVVEHVVVTALHTVHYTKLVGNCSESDII